MAAASLHLSRTRLCCKPSTFYFLHKVCIINSTFTTINQRKLAYSQRCLKEEPISHNHKRPRETIGESRLQKFRQTLKTFFSGSRLLGQDVKRMVQIKKKMKDNNYDWNVLTTEEILHLNQV